MFTIYSKPDCVFCKRAKDLLELLGEDFEEFNILEGNNRTNMNTALGYEARTVPQIWNDTTYVGGYTELVEYTK
jgi:glutaredoxin